MDKKSEIATLQSLKGDTYFGEFFDNKDIDQMCQNDSKNVWKEIIITI